MPKVKDLESKKIKNFVPSDGHEEKEVDPELILGDGETEETLEDESTGLDDDEVDPFGDKWEQ